MIVLLIPVIYIRQEYYANAIYLIIYLFINLLEPLELIIDLTRAVLCAAQPDGYMGRE